MALTLSPKTSGSKSKRGFKVNQHLIKFWQNKDAINSLVQIAGSGGSTWFIQQVLNDDFGIILRTTQIDRIVHKMKYDPQWSVLPQGKVGHRCFERKVTVRAELNFHPQRTPLSTGYFSMLKRFNRKADVSKQVKQFKKLLNSQGIVKI